MKCLAQGHNTAPLVRFKPATLRSRVWHSTELTVLQNGSVHVLSPGAGVPEAMHWGQFVLYERYFFVPLVILNDFLPVFPISS